jgi:hypothetical protein
VRLRGKKEEICVISVRSISRWSVHASEGWDWKADKKGVKTMEVEVGRITHYYNHLHVAVVKLTEPLQVGDFIHVLGHSTDFMQKATSLQIEYHNVAEAHPG